MSSIDETLYGVRSSAGVVTLARDLKQALSWHSYEFTTILGPVGEELVRFNGAEWETHNG